MTRAIRYGTGRGNAKVSKQSKVSKVSKDWRQGTGPDQYVDPDRV